MARFRHHCIVLAAEFFFFIVMFQTADGSRLMPPESGPYAAYPPDTIFENAAKGPVIRAIRKHYSYKKAQVGGDVILGGFVMALVVAVVCYIRLTRKSQKPHA
ncbi:Basic helix-loop-helix DNA-binding superfamily protein [Corchorus olitorius]|uniref:Basic helix-loop-helix DNA-binding superfamily protein n=1 Tax=Corchorus olitorius TaxID=93759 RepID=A0A1R3H3R5_9ROSI|nr:Basic helix-loop-helix DNA-binding superfamily protein [Corchorus olitorius]